MSKETKERIKEEVSVIKTPSFNSLLREYSFIASELELGEFTEELEEALKANKENFENKLLGMYYVIQLNESKIKGYYKPEIEDFKSRVDKLEKVSSRLKDNCMHIVNLFGNNGKLSTNPLNCTIVKKSKLGIDEDLHKVAIESLKSSIQYNNFENVSDNELDCYTASINIPDLPLETAAKIKELLEPMLNKGDISDIEVSIKVDKKLALERLEATDVVNNSNYNALPDTKDENGFTVKDTSNFEILDAGLQGLYIDETAYPLFS